MQNHKHLLYSNKSMHYGYSNKFDPLTDPVNTGVQELQKLCSVEHQKSS